MSDSPTGINNALNKTLNVVFFGMVLALFWLAFLLHCHFLRAQFYNIFVLNSTVTGKPGFYFKDGVFKRELL